MKSKLSFAVLLLAGIAFAEPEFLGKLDYTGGFTKDLKLTVVPSRVVKTFQLKVPEFCGQVDVLEAFTLTEGVADPAKPLGGVRHAFVVNNGAGARISAILVTLNGPSTASCAIPIFSEATGSTTDPESTVGMPYSQRRTHLLNRTNRLAIKAHQKHDIQVLRILQDIETLLALRTPAFLEPWHDKAYWTAVLNSAERTLNTSERMLNKP